MRFLPYGFGVRFTRERGFVVTNRDVDIRPKSPPNDRLSIGLHDPRQDTKLCKNGKSVITAPKK